MQKRFSGLKRIAGMDMISGKMQDEYMLFLENALLQALVEQNVLNLTQYHHAIDKLNRLSNNQDSREGNDEKLK